MNKKKYKINLTNYQESLFNKYEVDESYLQNRKQRRTCLELLEKIDKDKDFNEKKVLKKVVNAFKGTELHKKIATCMTITSLLINLQASPVMAEVISAYPPDTQGTKIEQQIENHTNVLMDDDSFLNDSLVVENGSENTSIRLVVAKNTDPLQKENSAFIDEDSELNYYENVKALTVIDTSIEDWEILTLGVEEGEILLLEGNDDPLNTIINKLKEMKEVDSLNIISHGSSGKLHFEDKIMSSETLEENREKWETLGKYLSKDGDVQLFGCNVAKGEKGKAFIKNLANITGADVAASINPTGNDALGGDWNLESVIGHVEENNVLQLKSMAQFKDILFCNICGDPFHDDSYHGGGGGDTTSPSVNSISINGDPASDATSIAFNVYFNETVRNVDTNDFSLTTTGTATGTINSVSPSSGTTIGVTVNDIAGNGTIRLDLKNSGTGIDDTSGNSISGGFTSGYAHTVTTTSVNDSNGTITAGTEVNESEIINIPTTADTVGEAVKIFDFKITDGGATGDGKDLTVTSAKISVSGANADKLTYVLTNPSGSGDLSADITGTYSGGKVTFDLSGNNITVKNGENETYVVKAYFNNNEGITDHTAINISIDGDTPDITVDGSGTQMATEQEAVTNDGKASMDVTATELRFTPQPAGSVSGKKLATQPVVSAVDADGNVDKDFTETITLTESSTGSLRGDVDVTAVEGIATFTDVIYTATVDKESFTLTANDEDGIGSDLNTVDANPLTSDVVATELKFTTQPSHTNILTGQVHDFTEDPVVKAVDAAGILDTDFTEIVTISENGAGNATFTNNSLEAVDGVATFAGLTINHDTAEPFQLVADDQDGVGSNLPVGTSTDIVAKSNQAPTLGGTFTIDGAIGDNETIKPFENVTVSDENGDSVSIKITFTWENGNLSGYGLDGSNGNYTLTSTDTETLQSRLQALQFIPHENQVAVGKTVETIFTLTPNDGTEDGTSNNTTKIIATSINTAPTLELDSEFNRKITRYDTNNEGYRVGRIFYEVNENDIDNYALNGMAITSIDEGTAKLQYCKKDTSIWIDIGDVSEDHALLLSDDDKIRFVPKNINVGTTGKLTFKIWDQTTGEIGSKMNTTVDGGTTAFSDTTGTGVIDVIAYPDDYIDITFSEPIYGSKEGTSPVKADDLDIIFNQNHGNSTKVEIVSVKKNDNASEDSASPLIGGEKTIRVFLRITGAPKGDNTEYVWDNGPKYIPCKGETIEIKPEENSIFDNAGNAMSTSQTTGKKTLSFKMVLSESRLE